MITVAVGIVVNNCQIFMGRRQSVDEHSPGLWEFPGGKVEAGESVEVALCREFQEELGAEITVLKPFLSLPWKYPKRDVQLEFYLVQFKSDDLSLKLNAHDEHRWVSENEFDALEVLPANRIVLEKLKSVLTPTRSVTS